MRNFSMWVAGIVVVGLFGGTSAAAEAVSAGKVKAVLADKKEFVLTDANNKDWTIKLGDRVVINRAGKEGKNDLEVGDDVSVCHDKGTFVWTAQYILVRAGAQKDCELVSGAIKGYDGDKKQLDFTDEHGKDWAFAMGDATVRLNFVENKVEAVRIGDRAVAIVEKNGDKTVLKAVMVSRK